MGVSKTSDNIQVKIMMSNPSQEPPACSKAQNKDLKDMDVLCTFKIKIESPNSDHGRIKDQWTFPNQDQDANPSQEQLAAFKSPNQDFKDVEIRELEFSKWVCLRSR